MEEQFGLVISERCCLRSAPGDGNGQNDSGIEDEIFSGWAVKPDPASAENGWVRVVTHYGYQGYIREECIRRIGRGELQARQDHARFCRIAVGEADLLQQPKVQGLPLELLLKNAFVELLSGEETEGWSRIRTAAGREGYIHTPYLAGRRDSDAYLLEGRAFDEIEVADEAAFREGLVRSAKAYLGTQYRWGGKSSQGLDCSGLAFMSYLENGVLIYRDARMVEGYPVRKIPAREAKKGDLIFFPGHVAMYLGEGRYIHSTAYSRTPCVTVNSLSPGDSDYRQDLAEKITAFGSIFASGADMSEQKDEARHVKAAAKAYWKRLAGRLERMPGSVSFVFLDPESGRRFGFREREPHIAASIIKLFLMAAVFDGIERGRIREEDTVRVRRADCVPSCGVLTYLPGERSVTVRELLELMIIVSDNTAANLLFDLTGAEALARFIRETLGMERTVFHRKMFDSESAAHGIENYVTAEDAARLLELIWRGELVSPEASAEMYRILTHQRLNGKIPFYLHTLKPQPVIAHKTGEDTGITHDVAIVEGRKPFILCFLGSGTDVPAYERLMAEVSMEIFQSDFLFPA